MCVYALSLRRNRRRRMVYWYIQASAQLLASILSTA